MPSTRARNLLLFLTKIVLLPFTILFRILISLFERIEIFFINDLANILNLSPVHILLSSSVLLILYFLLTTFQYDICYDSFIIIELILTLYLSYYILEKDLKYLRLVVGAHQLAYESPNKIARKLLELKIGLKLFVAIIILVLTAHFVLITTHPSNYSLAQIRSYIANFSIYNFISEIQRLLHNEHLHYKIIHFFTSLALMIFATQVISNISTHKVLLIYEKIINNNKPKE